MFRSERSFNAARIGSPSNIAALRRATGARASGASHRRRTSVGTGRYGELVRAIFAALRDAVTPGEFDDITSRLDRSCRPRRFTQPAFPPPQARRAIHASPCESGWRRGAVRGVMERSVRPAMIVQVPDGRQTPGRQSPTSSSNRTPGVRAMTITGQAASAVTCRMTPPRTVAECGP